VSGFMSEITPTRGYTTLSLVSHRASRPVLRDGTPSAKVWVTDPRIGAGMTNKNVKIIIHKPHKALQLDIIM